MFKRFVAWLFPTWGEVEEAPYRWFSCGLRRLHQGPLCGVYVCVQIPITNGVVYLPHYNGRSFGPRTALFGIIIERIGVPYTVGNRAVWSLRFPRWVFLDWQRAG